MRLILSIVILFFIFHLAPVNALGSNLNYNSQSKQMLETDLKIRLDSEYEEWQELEENKAFPVYYSQRLRRSRNVAITIGAVVGAGSILGGTAIVISSRSEDCSEEEECWEDVGKIMKGIGVGVIVVGALVSIVGLVIAVTQNSRLKQVNKYNNESSKTSKRVVFKINGPGLEMSF